MGGIFERYFSLFFGNFFVRAPDLLHLESGLILFLYDLLINRQTDKVQKISTF